MAGSLPASFLQSTGLAAEQAWMGRVSYAPRLGARDATETLGGGYPEGFICKKCKITLFSYDEKDAT